MSDGADFSENLSAEIHVPFKARLKNNLRSLCSPVMRWLDRRVLKRVSGLFAKELGCSNYFFEEGRYTNLDLIRIANNLCSLRDKEILVVGCGYGRHLFSIAKLLRPKVLHAVDIYSHELWKEVASEVMERTGVVVKFYEGSLQEVAASGVVGLVDACLSDAVLEHVQDMSSFLEAANSLLLPNGLFYASFGPLWFSPAGDHFDWGSGHEYDHLTLSSNDYQHQWEKAGKIGGEEYYSTEAYFMYQKKLFSYLKPAQYLDFFKQHFLIDELWVGISKKAWALKMNKSSVYEQLASRYGETAVLSKALIVYMRKKAV